MHQITSLKPSGIYKQMLLELFLEATLSQGDYSGCIKSDYKWTFDQTECVQIIVIFWNIYVLFNLNIFSQTSFCELFCMKSILFVFKTNAICKDIYIFLSVANVFRYFSCLLSTSVVKSTDFDTIRYWNFKNVHFPLRFERCWADY